MNVTVNGKPMEVATGTTVEALAESLGIKIAMTAVQVNDTIIPKEQLDGVNLSDGDVVELIRIVGGG